MIGVLLALSLGATPAQQPAGEFNLAVQLDKPGRLVDVSNRYVFGLRWREPVVHTGYFRKVLATFGRPAISLHSGLVIVGTGEGKVLALRLADGALAWSYDYGEPFESAVSLFDVVVRGELSEEVAFVGSRDGNLLALRVADGTLVWKTNVDGDVRAPASRSGNLLIVANANNQVHALEIATGKPLWSARRPPPSKLTVIGHASPLVADGVVYAAFSDGYVEAYDVTDGGRRWSRPVSLKGGEFVDSDADPVIDAGKLFVASYSDGVYALDPQDGRTLWTRAAPAVQTLAVRDGRVVAGSGDGWLWGLAESNGRLLYRTRVAGGMVSRIELQDDLVVFGAGKSGLVVLDAENGRPLQATGYGTRMQGDAVWSGSEVALLSAPGYLYTFSRGHSRIE